MRKNSRWTETDSQGNWALKGVKWKYLSKGAVIKEQTAARLYGALAKLRDYENTGLTPEQIEEMDGLYEEKCKEVAKWKKRADELAGGRHDSGADTE